MGLITLFFLGSAIVPFFFLFSVLYIIGCAFAALTWGNSVSLISLAAKKEEQGVTMGTAQSLIALASFFGPFMGAFVATYSVNPILYICSGGIFVAFLMLLAYQLLPPEGGSL